MVLGRAKEFSQIVMISAMTGTKCDSLNNNLENVLHVEHEACLLNRSRVAEERLNIIWHNT